MTSDSNTKVMSEGDLRWGTVVNVQIDEDFDAGSVQNTAFVY